MFFFPLCNAERCIRMLTVASIQGETKQTNKKKIHKKTIVLKTVQNAGKRK